MSSITWFVLPLVHYCTRHAQTTNTFPNIFEHRRAMNMFSSNGGKEKGMDGKSTEDIPREDLLNLCMKLNKSKYTVNFYICNDYCHHRIIVDRDEIFGK